MFEHSVKVPRQYKVAANIFKKVSTEGGSVKTLLYDDKLRHFRTNVLYALITETIKHAADIDKIFESTGFLKAETRLDPWLAKVLTSEILFGKKSLPGKSKPEQTILSYKDKFQTFVNENDGDFKTKETVRRPRYVRINTNLLTTSDAIRAFQDEGFKFIRCTSGSYNDYLEQIQNLAEYDFSQDYHVKTVFVFAPGTKWHDYELYLENKIILQDKATSLAVHLLAPPPNSVVLDMCAAPGMKTTQVAAYLRNEGKIYAVERNEQRYQTLCDFVEKTGSKCVETLHKDSLEIKRGDYADVEYILLDPSCSGSGMELCVHNYIEDSRLAKLTSLQEKFLKHAMNSFPNAKRIVYSTCSLLPEENERVITNVVKTSRAKWRVQDVNELLKGQWNNFGSGMYGSMGTRCLYARPDTDFTIGFFLAVLDRDQKEKCSISDANAVKEKCKNDTLQDKKMPNDNKIDINDVKNQLGSDEKLKCKKKKRKKSECNVESALESTENVSENIDVANENETKKNKKKKKSKDILNCETNVEQDNHNKETLNDGNSEVLDVKEMPEFDVKVKSKKMKRKRTEINSESELNASVQISEDTNIENEKKVKKRKNSRGISESDANLEDNCNNVVEHDLENIPNESQRKKKKKKHKGDERSVPEEMSSNIEITEVSKMKRKKKHKNNNEVNDF